MRISEWSSDVCSSDLIVRDTALAGVEQIEERGRTAPRAVRPRAALDLDHVGATTLQQMRAQRPGPQSRKIDDAWRVAHWRRGLVQGSSAYQLQPVGLRVRAGAARDRKSTRLNSSH